MAYYADLTRYSYSESDEEMCNVGWLAAKRGYPRGIVDERVVDALKALSAAYDNQMRGIHHCEFCDADRPVVLGGPTMDREVWLGSAEIRVRGADGTLYAAPNLAIHYITEHQYRPPEEFCRAVARAVGIEAVGPLTLVD